MTIPSLCHPPSLGISDHLWQIGADRAARVAVGARVPARAMCRHVIGERENLRVATIARDQIGEPIASRAPAFRALDPQRVELADQVGEDDRAIAGHGVYS